MSPIQATTPGIHGSTICTHSGLYFDFTDPRPEQIEISDIAWALAHICRFGGHTKQFYSVAQHCVLAARHIEHPAWARDALLHDASEAYTGDMVRPLKNLLPEFKEIELRIEMAIAKKFNTAWSREKAAPWVKKVDLVLLKTEQRDLTAAAGHAWSGLYNIDALEDTIIPWSPDLAYANFMMTWSAVGAD